MGPGADSRSRTLTPDSRCGNLVLGRGRLEEGHLCLGETGSSHDNLGMSQQALRLGRVLFSPQNQPISYRCDGGLGSNTSKDPKGPNQASGPQKSHPTIPYQGQQGLVSFPTSVQPPG